MPLPWAQKLKGLVFRHPLYDTVSGRRGWKVQLQAQKSPLYLADYVTATDGTGIVHSAPAYGVDDFNSCVAHGLATDDILNPVQGNGVYADELPFFGGQHIWKACERVIEVLGQSDRLMATQAHHPQLPALLAPQDAGDLPRRGAVVRAHGRRRWRVHEGQGAQDPAPTGAGRDRPHAVLPRERTPPPARHDRQPAGLVHQPPAQLGRARAVLPAQGFSGELHPRTMDILDQAAGIVEQGGIEAWSRVTPEEILGA